MATTVTIPDFQFASFFYADLLDALLLFKRTNVPELTDESEFEPLIQILRAFALVGHLNNVNLDIVANESTIVTARIPEQIRNMLKLIDFDLESNAPSQVDLIYELSKVFTAAFEVIPDQSQAATPKEGDADPVFFEADEALTIDPTDVLSYAYGEDGGVLTNYTTQANSPTTPADDWAPWSTPAVKDAVYFGHKHVMWNLLAFTLTTVGGGYGGVWEYYDGDFDKTTPDSVTDIGGGQLEFVLNGYLGAVNRAGTLIRVKLNDTGAFEDVEVVWTGSENKVTTGLLGQSSPSTTFTDYTIGSDWEPMPDQVDETTVLTAAGDLSYTLPQTLTNNWTQGTPETPGGNTLPTAFWMRFRITEVSVPVSPVIQRARIDQGKQYVQRSATQGRTQSDNPLGSSTGVANQSFETTRVNYIAGSMVVTVDGNEWTEVENFLQSAPTDEHYVVELGESDVASVVFGDGINGKVPPIGVGNIVATYRFGADVNGNVGSNTVTIDKAGLTFVNNITNPRPATGWTAGDASSTEALERAKVLGPTTLRVKNVAIAATDLIPLTQRFEDDNGARPFSRAQVFEEGFGPKTVELVVVASGGGQATTAQLEALELYFNGDKFATPPVEAKFVSNQEVVAVNYTQRVIDVTAVVTSSGNVTPEQIENALAKVIQPEALKDDGVTYEWNFGGEVPMSRISHEIFEVDETITKVELTIPSGDITLTNRELPVLGTTNITVIEP